jgi:hypothetical protein
MNTMPKVKCKTSECPYWLIVDRREIKISAKIAVFPVLVRPWEYVLRCPECGKEYVYSNADVP